MYMISAMAAEADGSSSYADVRVLAESPVEGLDKARAQVVFRSPPGCAPEPRSSPADLGTLLSGPTGVCLPWTRPATMSCPAWESECWVAVLPRAFHGTVTCSTPHCSFTVSFVEADATADGWWWPPDGLERETLDRWLAGTLSEGWAQHDGDRRVVHIDRATLAALARCVEGPAEPVQGHVAPEWAVRLPNGMGRYGLLSFYDDRVAVGQSLRALRPGCVDAVLE